ncbi:MAG: hypothetical protein PVI59_08935 [Anaerolineae bacterium]|jgi:hypothetical protein
MKKLEGLKWVPRWVSHLGCVEGCLDYLGVNVSDAWLFGATGHAFVINVDEVVCPSGPTSWDTEMLFRLGKNVGYDVGGVFGLRSTGDLMQKQRQAWDHVRAAVDQDLPCYGWELDIPEYYVVYGYDDVGYYFSGPGCDQSRDPKPWRELGATEIGVVEMYSVKPGEVADDTQTVRQALAFALEHAANPARWIFPEYGAGLTGYDHWIRALEGGTADGLGVAYNAAVWCECRGYAALFLQEAKDRLEGRAGDLFDEAIERYQLVHQNLRTVTDVFPFHDREPEHVHDPERVRTALGALRVAREQEALGLETLRHIVAEL